MAEHGFRPPSEAASVTFRKKVREIISWSRCGWVCLEYTRALPECETRLAVARVVLRLAGEPGMQDRRRIDAVALYLEAFGVLAEVVDRKREQ